MITREALEEYADLVQKVAEERLIEDGQLHTLVGVWRDGEPFMWIWPGNPRPDLGDEHGRDPLLRVCWAAIRGMSPDGISIAQDTYIATSMTKTNGEEWGPGEMQQAREQRTEDYDLVSDCLMVQYIDALGDAAMVSWRYEIEDTAFGTQRVKWGEKKAFVESESEDERLGGYVMDVIREAFSKPTLQAAMRKAAKEEADPMADEATAARARRIIDPAGNFPESTMTAQEALEFLEEHPVEAFAHQMCAVAKIAFVPNQINFAVSATNPVVLEIFKESFRGFPGVEIIEPGEL